MTMNGTIAASGARLRRLLRGDYGPTFVLVIVVVLLGAYTWAQNSHVTSAYNITTTLTLVTATAFASYGQLMVILTGGIDLSVGPLMGLLVVIASFFINDGSSASCSWASRRRAPEPLTAASFASAASIRLLPPW
jgi:ribose transport system ATP-binding protein